MASRVSATPERSAETTPGKFMFEALVDGLKSTKMSSKMASRVSATPERSWDSEK